MKKFWIITICSGLIICGGAIYAGYNLRGLIVGEPDLTLSAAEQAGNAAPDITQSNSPLSNSAAAELDDNGETSDDAVFIEDEEKIRQGAKIVYEYALWEGGYEQREEEAPRSLIGMTQSGVSGLFSSWDVMEFSAERVVLRNRDGANPPAEKDAYIVGVKDGYVAVFYQAPPNGDSLKEMTNMPVSALPQAERERLSDGIPVAGDAQLARIMEDYGS